VRVGGEVLGLGEGASRRVAETHAAAQALDRLQTRELAGEPSPVESAP
jgi:dsRNA-specific ribonuclease